MFDVRYETIEKELTKAEKYSNHDVTKDISSRFQERHSIEINRGISPRI